MGREILTIQIGGAGKHLGTFFWPKLLEENSPIFFHQFGPRVIDCDIASANCYAKAFHTVGPPVAHRVLSEVRRAVEKCDALQAVQFFHSLTGGAGSGLTGLLLKSVAEELGSSPVLYSACLAPAKNHSNVVLESFNATLCLQDLTEYCQMVFPFQDDEFSKIASSLVGMTSSLRCPGSLNADLRKLHSSLVPFKKTHFLHTNTVSGSKLSPLDLAHKALVSQSVGDRYLATFLAYSGKSVSPSEVDFVTSELQKTNSQLDPYFPDWIPNSVSASICAGSTKSSLTCVTNRTDVRHFFDRITNDFDKQFNAQSHMYIYAEHGIHSEEMLEARNLLKSVSNEYKEYAQWDDKIMNSDTNNFEQAKIVQELQLLKNCYIE